MGKRRDKCSSRRKAVNAGKQLVYMMLWGEEAPKKKKKVKAC